MAQRAKAQTGSGKRGRSSKKSSAGSERLRKRPQSENLIFALDIGTRTVIGIVGERVGADGFRVKDYELMEHPGRAMVDGQVEDIAQVGRLILEVQRRLEARLRTSLSRVSIAAAGRMLRTARSSVRRELAAPHSIVERDMVLGLEGEAIELAQEQLRQEGGQPQGGSYYCVGYSIVEYTMDGQPVSQLAGHTCSEVGVELIAAFLPYSVIEGLYAAVDMSRLEVQSLTLEPIAAINVLIPRELRLLNLALVDVGAGTSDIAICRDGRVASYDMATIAGDELTEAIIREYLVDFPEAERLKKNLSSGAEILHYENVLGLPGEAKVQDIHGILKPAVELLARTVADKILACNGGPPSAVFLIGGGSQVPGLGQALAACLQIAPENVAVGSRRNLKGMDVAAFPALTGPEFVTPLGIALTAITQECFQFFGVSVNGRRLKLLNASHTRLMEVLLMAGYKSSQLVARSGRSLLFTLNGAPHTVRGGLPEHAVVTINGAPASIESDVRPGDAILITPARSGEPATAIAADFLPAEGLATVLVNGEIADPARPIVQGDKVDVRPLPAIPAAESAPQETPAAQEEAELAESEAAQIAAEAALENEPAEAPAPEAPAAPAQVQPAENKAGPATMEITLNGQPLSLPLSERQQSYFIMNLLEKAGVDPAKPQGQLIMECNGAAVGFLHPLQAGAEVRIGWQ